MNSGYVLPFFDVILKEVPVLDYLIIHFQIASFDAMVSCMEIYID